MKYKVEFEFLVPEFHIEEVEASGNLEARDIAMDAFEKIYPEAMDVEVIEVSEIA